jgi:hypothetical protein
MEKLHGPRLCLHFHEMANGSLIESEARINVLPMNPMIDETTSKTLLLQVILKHRFEYSASHFPTVIILSLPYP